MVAGGRGMVVRNFWIEGQVDGRKSFIATGPRSKDGGFWLTIYMRDKGGSRKVIDFRGFCSGDDLLMLEVYEPDAGRLALIQTKR